MGILDELRSDRGQALTNVHRPGGSGSLGLADFLQNIFSGGGVSDSSSPFLLRGNAGARSSSPHGDPGGKPSIIPVDRSTEEEFTKPESGLGEFGRGGLGSTFARTGPREDVNVPEDQKLDLFDEVRARNEIIGEGIKIQEALNDFEENNDLTAEDREQVKQMREQAALMIQQAEAEEASILRQQFQQGKMGQRLQDELFGNDPILPGATPEQTQILNRALGRSQFGEGVSNDELLTIMDEIIESNLSEDEKEERLDFIAARTGMRDELQTTLNNVITDRRGLDKMEHMTDIELLGNEADFNTIQMDFTLSTDPALQVNQGLTTMIDEGYEELTGKELPPSVAVKLQNEEGTGLLDTLLANPDLLGTPGFQQRASDIAAELKIPFGSAEPGNRNGFMGMLAEGLDYGGLRVGMWDDALNKSQFTPQSEQLAMAIFQVAESLVGADMANKMANSQDLHMIIASQSGGMVGRDIGDGNKHGLGGLTDEGYESIGVEDYEEIRGDTAEEIAALVKYIVQRYGDPVEAINAYKRNGIWGD